MTRPASLLLMAASGCAGLGYQIVWTQQSALWLGHEAAAVLAVVTAFFGGLALGALALGPRIERSAHPARWYAGCEAAMALWGGVLLAAMAPFSGWLLGITGVQPAPAWQWLVAFCGSFLLLLPATAAMGATLPAMARLVAADRGRGIGALYAANTAGAVVGVLAAAFWLVPALGLVRTAGLCIAINLFCAAGALRLFRRPVLPTTTPPPAAGGQGALARLALTGLLGIGYEVLVVRVLSQIAEDTVYTFALLLAVYLVGTALGAAAWQRWWARRCDADRLLGALALACLAGTASLWAGEHVKAWALATLAAGMPAAIAGEALLALLAFGLPTFLMGALFSQLSAEASAGGAGFARALGANTLGAAAAPLLFGVLLVPVLGAKAALLLVCAGYLVLTAPRHWFRPHVLVPTAALLATAVATPPLVFIEMPAGGRVVRYDEGVMAAVSVVADADGVSRLRINNRQQEGSSATRFVDGRQAMLPLLLHAAPQRALFLGLGTGVTANAATLDPSLQAVDAVELLPEVIAASAHFNPPSALNLIASDARRFVRTSVQHYDVIVSDNFHPARSGSGSLYTVEHFRAVRERLARGGLFCQWLPLHQLDLATLRSIVRSFMAVYPQGAALLASNSLETPVLGLVGRADDGRFTAAPLRRPGEAGIDDEWALFGSFVAGPSALVRFAGDAALNTDDHPVVAALAPRVTYAPEDLPRDRLLSLLQTLSLAPDELMAPGTDPAWLQRLAAYTAARNGYLAAGRDVRPVADARQMLQQVQQPLLAALRTSPDFRPAYDPLLHLAAVLAGSDVSAARGLLAELAQLQPARPEARAALHQLVTRSPTP